MKLNDMKEDENVLVIGCGRLGSSIANIISNRNKSVSIIDISKDSFRKLSPSFGGLVLEGDATDLEVLKEAQMQKPNVVVVATNNDNINIMVAQMVKKIFDVNKVIIRLYDPERECIFKGMGIHSIFPVQLSANEVDKILEEED